MKTVPFDMGVDEIEQLAWLCEMAGRGCAHENRSKWAAQLFEDAKRLRRQAAEMRVPEAANLRARG